MSDVLQHLGDLKRQNSDRVATVRFNSSGSLMGSQVAGKVVEIYRVRNEEETLKQAKRRLRRKREKALTKTTDPGSIKTKDDIVKETEGDPEEPSVSDRFKLLQVMHLKQKIRSFSFSDSTKKNNLATVAFALHDNSLEVYDLTEDGHSIVHTIDLPGHRSDVRSLTLSSDNTLLMSTSHNALKIWNPINGTCLRTMEAGYGLTGLFVPGNRYSIVGTKTGTLEIFDIGASERVKVVEAHGGAIWSIASMPNGQGFISGSADHEVKFWDYELVQDSSNVCMLYSIVF
jgi:U3 small nucleolar RNA-associated protein 12